MSATAPAELFAREPLAFAPGALLLPDFALDGADALVEAIAAIAAAAPFRSMTTPGGRAMSVATTSCGERGWVSDRRGYRYAATDPASGRPWPAMPSAFRRLAEAAAAAGGYSGFAPDSCLINRYAAGTRMGLHQDRDEADLAQPIVSVSLGLPATFLWAGASRTGRPLRLALHQGDVVLWGGRARLDYHGIAPLPGGDHPATGPWRYNLTFRRAA